MTLERGSFTSQAVVGCKGSDNLGNGPNVYLVSSPALHIRLHPASLLVTFVSHTRLDQPYPVLDNCIVRSLITIQGREDDRKNRYSRNYTLVDEQAVLVHVVLLDKLSKLVGFLGVIELVQVQDLVSRPIDISNS
nr:hypothetical protein [uncultured organism]